MALSFRLEQFLGVLLNVLAIFLQVQFSSGKNATKSQVNGTHSDNTTRLAYKPMPKTDFKGMTFRAIYVITAVSGAVVVYFIVRAICSKRRRNRTRRYGILGNESRDSMEMRPLSEGDDDDDDLTLFDMSKRNGKR